MPKIVAAALALYSFFLIESTLPSLPSRIPTHFNFAGEPDQWGSPHMLWILLVLQVLLASILLSIPAWGRRFPQAVHLGTRNLSDFTSEQREHIMPLLKNMAGFMSVAASLFFIYLIRETIRVAEHPHSRMRMGWAAGFFVAGMVGISLYYLLRINAVVKDAQSG